MKKKLLDQLEQAKKLHDITLEKSAKGSFAHTLAAQSLESHMDELKVLSATTNESLLFEMMDFRIKAETLETGTAPLHLVENITREVRKMIGYAALKIQGGETKKRISNTVDNLLDLRLVGLLPGSSRFIISATADRTLFNEGLSQNALERVFSVLDTKGEGENFLTAVNTLGPLSAKSMKNIFHILKNYSAEAELTWKYAGQKEGYWNGTKDVIDSVSEALEVVKLKNQEELLIHGKIELLSKREKIELRLDNGDLIKVLYPKSILEKVSELHLGEDVSLKCLLTENENILTKESSILYELLAIED